MSVKLHAIKTTHAETITTFCKMVGTASLYPDVFTEKEGGECFVAVTVSNTKQAATCERCRSASGLNKRIIKR